MPRCPPRLAYVLSTGMLFGGAAIMKLAVAMTTYHSGISGLDLPAAVARVENAGLDGAWFFETLGRGYFNFDPFGAICAAAAVTRSIELGVGVVQAPLRHPIDLAQRALTAHHLSNGRFLFGVGTGASQETYSAFGLRFEERFERLESSITTMQALWRGETVDGLNLTPWPSMTGGPPVFIGSWAGGRWIRIAAEQHAGWIGSATYTSFGELKKGVARFKALGGQRAIATNIQIDLEAVSAGRLSDDDHFDLRCSPAEAANRLKQLQDCGFDDAVVFIEYRDRHRLEAIRALFG